MSFLLGLTGSIGMGKSTTAQMFRDLGLPVWDADETVHRLYAKDGQAVDKIWKIFPKVIENGAVSRGALRKLISENPDTLGQIEQIVHPLVAADREEFIEQATADILVFDIPLLYETSAETWLSAVACVTTSAENQRDRVLARGTMDEAQFEAILARQYPDAKKRERADFIIRTDTLDQTRERVADIVAQIRKDLR